MSFACPGKSSGRRWGGDAKRSHLLLFHFPHELMRTQMSHSNLAQRLVVIAQSFQYAEHPSSPWTFPCLPVSECGGLGIFAAKTQECLGKCVFIDDLFFVV